MARGCRSYCGPQRRSGVGWGFGLITGTHQHSSCSFAVQAQLRPKEATSSRCVSSRYKGLLHCSALRCAQARRHSDVHRTSIPDDGRAARDVEQHQGSRPHRRPPTASSSVRSIGIDRPPSLPPADADQRSRPRSPAAASASVRLRAPSLS